MAAYQRVTSKQYRKDVERLRKAGADLRKLDQVVLQLSEGRRLDGSHRDHALSGEFEGYRECHVGSDWLLVYKILHHELILVLVRTGDHRRVLGVE